MNIVEMDEQNVPLPKMYVIMALPAVLNMVTTMVYSVADTWFISATGNINLIAGVSLNAPVLMLLMAFGNIFGQGGCTLLSQLIGQKKTDSARQVSAACFYLALVFGVAAGILMILFQRPILYLLGASENTVSYAASYYRWMAIGAPFIVLSFVPRNTLRSEGMSRESMIGTMSGTILNIILDPVFIFGFGFGAAGAAMATVIGYVVTDVYSVLVMLKKSRMLSVSIYEIKISAADLGKVFSIGIPSAITNIMQSISGILINQFLLPYGDDQIAAMGIAMKVSMIGQLILVGMSFGSLPLFGYYFGGNNKERFRQLSGFCMRAILIAGAVLTVVLFAAAPALISLFAEDAGLLHSGILMMRLQVCSLIFVGIILMLAIIFQSMGRAMEMFFLSVSRQGIIFLAVLLILSAMAGYYGVIAAQAVSDFCTALIAAGLYLRVRRMGF